MACAGRRIKNRGADCESRVALALALTLPVASAGLVLAASYVDAHYDGTRWRTSREIADAAAWRAVLRDTPEDALAKIEAYLDDYPTDIPLRLKAGELAERIKRHAAAVAHYEEVRRLDPGNAGAAKGLARSFSALAQDDLALFHWEEASRLLPKDASVHRELGLALRKKGDAPRAMAAIQQSLLLDPGQHDLHAVLSELAMARELEELPDDPLQLAGAGSVPFDPLDDSPAGGAFLPRSAGHGPSPIDPSRYLLESVRPVPRMRAFASTRGAGVPPATPTSSLPKPRF